MAVYRFFVACMLPCLLFGWPPAARAQLQSPQEFLGYALGDHFTPHHRVVAYLEHVAAEADHVTLTRYGTTNEGRPLVYAVVSSPDNMRRMDKIQSNNLRLDELDETKAPAIVWLSYNVHGNEAASTEAAMATLYALTRADTQAWLRETVVILDPCINPDGRDRYVHFFNRTVGKKADVHPDAREHAEPWPSGRTNHYYFDLNRDWAWGTQVETRLRLRHYNQWMPHIHVDFHEQGVDQPYYFAPAAEPYHAAITPWQRELQQLIGDNHARYFDQQGWLFFTRQIFDLFYPGYGDTWPMFNGAIGMTYEQGGSSRAGLGIVTTEGDTLTLRDRLEHHKVTSLSTIETAATHRARIVSEFKAYFRQSREQPPGRYQSFVIKPGQNLDRLGALKRHLEFQGITFGHATVSRMERGFSYRTGQEGPVQISPGDMLVSTAQPKGVLASVLFEPEAALVDSLSYDITAWALPYVYGVDAYALAARVTSEQVGTEPAPVPTDSVTRPAAYLAEWKSFEDAQLLSRLLQAGVRVRFTEEPFTTRGREYAAGTLILTRAGNERLGEDFDRIVRETASALNQPLHAVSTTQVSRGVDFGSSDVPFLKKPRVAVVAGTAVSSYGLGELWHWFDALLGYPVTLVEADAFRRLHLFNFDVIVLPHGSYSDVLGEERLKAVLAWIKDGGRLIALEGAARFLAGKDGFGLKRKEEDKKNDDTDAAKKDSMQELRIYGERNRQAISERVTGAVFKAHLDNTHPLAFGYGDTYFTLKRDDTAFSYLKDAWNVGTLRADARVSGFAGAKTLKPLEHSLLFGVEALGRGEVIYLLDNPVFRGFWYSGRLLLANAVFLVGHRTPARF